jgi:hypothetical protein
MVGTNPGCTLSTLTPSHALQQVQQNFCRRLFRRNALESGIIFAKDRRLNTK